MTSRDNLRDRRRSSDRQCDDGHGRTVARPCRVTSDLDRREGREAWTDPRSGVLSASERSLGDAPSVARRSSLGSPGSDARLWNEAVRSHWGGGKSLHRVPDVMVDEGRSRIRKGNARRTSPCGGGWRCAY